MRTTRSSFFPTDSYTMFARLPAIIPRARALPMTSAVRVMGISRLHQTARVFDAPRSPSEENLRRAREHYQRFQDTHEESQRKRRQTSAYYAASLMMFFLGLSCVAVPFYRYLCKRTGWDGTPITDQRSYTTDQVVPVETNKRIRISFTCQASGILPWKFTPLQKEVYIVPGETALAFYKAKNMSKEDIVGMATYSVTPDNVAPYFNKIQCFCFEEQRLAAGEEVDMPVFFFIDPDFAKDPSMKTIDDVVLHYSFFKASYQNGELAPIPMPQVSVKAEAT